MTTITVPVLLESFEKEVNAGALGFLEAAPARDKEWILRLLADLRLLFEEAAPDEENLNWHTCHGLCTELWTLLTRLALTSIDDTSKGNARLSKFLEESTKFEEVLYGLDPFYRDHTLHSVWVYLLGEYLMRGQLRATYDDLNWYLWNDVDTEADWKHLRSKARAAEKRLREQVDADKDAIWCLTALCHDLGYALSKLEDINERVAQVLRQVDLHGFERIGYSLPLEHQYLTQQFLELMADDMRIEADREGEDVLVKLYRDDGSYWRLCDSLERREHGTLSAFVLYKVLGVLGDATLRGPSEQWGLDDDEAVDTLIRGTILWAVAQHAFRYVWADEMGSLADVLLLADEVEEFSRWGRPLMTRKYLPTLAQVSLAFDYRKQGDESMLAIDVDYNVHEDADAKGFFERKAKRLVDVYHLRRPQTGGRPRIGRPRAESKFPKIGSITMSVSHKNSKFVLRLDRESISVELPAPDTRNAKLINDELYLLGDDGDVTLTEFLRSMS